MPAVCAAVNSPSSGLIDTIPVVRVRESKVVPEDHIIFIPANSEFPIKFSVKGTLFTEDISSTVMASIEGKNWVNSHKLLSVEPGGGFDRSGGQFEVGVNLKD